MQTGAGDRSADLNVSNPTKDDNAATKKNAEPIKVVAMDRGTSSTGTGSGFSWGGGGGGATDFTAPAFCFDRFICAVLEAGLTTMDRVNESY
jgi:hypothetical protein